MASTVIQIKDDTSANQDSSQSDVKIPSLICLPLAPLAPPVRFIVCSAAVFVFYLIYGYTLEYVFKIKGIENHGWFVTFLQFSYYSFFALVQLAISKQTVRTKVSLKMYTVISLVTLGTMGFSNVSMIYLNYPTQVIFKSCKLIPVMIGSVILLHKRYSFSQVLSCLLMCAGLIWFSLADSTVQPHFSIEGVVLVSMALCCDALIGNIQEVVLRHNNEPSARLVLYSHGLGLLILAVLMILSGTYFAGVIFTLENCWDVIPAMLVLSLSGYFGVQAVLALVSLYGALAAVTVTTARKAVSILLSFLLFTKPFTLHYLWGGLVVVFGVYLSVLSKQQHSVTLMIDNLYSKFSEPLFRKSSSLLSRQNVNNLYSVLYRYQIRLKSLYRRCTHARPSHQFKFDV